MRRAAAAYRSTAILNKPKAVKQEMPVGDGVIFKLAGTSTIINVGAAVEVNVCFLAEEEKKARKEFPNQKEAEANEEANKAFLERVSLGQFCGAKNATEQDDEEGGEGGGREECGEVLKVVTF
jgi:hypothetical protein